MNRNAKDGHADQAKAVTVDRGAAMLSVSKRTIWRLIAAGELTAIRLGRSVRIEIAAIEALIARGGTK